MPLLKAVISSYSCEVAAPAHLASTCSEGLLLTAPLGNEPLRLQNKGNNAILDRKEIILERSWSYISAKLGLGTYTVSVLVFPTLISKPHRWKAASKAVTIYRS
jgi:hypothetical protein